MSEALARETDISAQSTWSVGTLRDYFLGLINANDRRYGDEARHFRQVIETMDSRMGDHLNVRDHAVEVAFTAQQRAVDTAFAAQQTGLNAALLAQKEAVATALIAAEKAVSAALMSSAQAVQKAEAAAERRFDSVNEFRQTLADQQRMLIPRAEVEVIISAMADKIDRNGEAVRDIGNRIAALTAAAGAEKHGLQTGWGYAVGVIGIIIAAATVIISVVLRKA